MKISVIKFIFFIFAIFLVSCANPGNPDGGPYDETPPQLLLNKKHPTGSTLTFTKGKGPGTKVEIFFDEIVQIQNATEKVVVSPPQENMPDIATKGKYIQVKLNDSLKSNTTYTIDFSDAIVDNNEGNPMGSFTFVFSTGESVDTMQISGTVLNAADLEPIKGILVGIHSNMADTAFTKLPFERVARTDSRGHFVIKGVASGTYKVFALSEADGDFRYSQKSEKIAFMDADVTATTGCYPDDSLRYDSIRHKTDTIYYTHFTPDDIVLRAFTASHSDRHLLKTERNVSEHFEVYFTAPSTSLPIIEGINFDAKDAFVVDYNDGKDTLCYWIKDTTLIYQDTLSAVLTYLENDSIGQLVERSDSIDFVSKFSHEKQMKWAADALKKWKKEQEKNKKKGLPYQKEYPIPELGVDRKGSGELSPLDNLYFKFKEPLASADTSKIHLYLQRDSVYVPARYEFVSDPNSILGYTLKGEWRDDQQYKLVIDSAAFVSIYGHATKRDESKFVIPTADKFTTLFVNLPDVKDTTGIVQLLSSDKVVAASRTKDGFADFYCIKPGPYYLRMFIDMNGNGKWDEGDYEQGIQPEETYYYPSRLELRAKWDETVNWNIHEIPLDKQKPLEITKQKPEKEKTIKNRNAERERNMRK